MLTKAQKKKREELKRKLIPVFKGTAALALIFIGFLYWSNGNRSDEPDSGKIYSSEVNERTEKNVSKKNEPQESHKESVTVTQKPVQHVEEEVPQVSVSVTEEPVVSVTEQKMYDENGRLNINTAGRAELIKLNGIGEKRANDIIEYREKNGGFTRIEDIMKVKGIKQGIFSKIKDYIYCP